MTDHAFRLTLRTESSTWPGPMAGGISSSSIREFSPGSSSLFSIMACLRGWSLRHASHTWKKTAHLNPAARVKSTPNFQSSRILESGRGWLASGDTAYSHQAYQFAGSGDSARNPVRIIGTSCQAISKKRQNVRKLDRNVRAHSWDCCTLRRISLLLRHTITYPAPHFHPSFFPPSFPNFPLPATFPPKNTWDPHPAAPSIAVISALPRERRA